MAEDDLRRAASLRSQSAKNVNAIRQSMPQPPSGDSAPPAPENVAERVSEGDAARSHASQAVRNVLAPGLPPLSNTSQSSCTVFATSAKTHATDSWAVGASKGGSGSGDGSLLEFREREVAAAMEHDLLLEREMERTGEQGRKMEQAREGEIAWEERDKEKEELEQKDRKERETEKREEAARAAALRSREQRAREEAEIRRREREVEEDDSLDSSSGKKAESHVRAVGTLSMQVLELTKEHDLLLEGRKGIGEQGSKRRHEEGLGEVGNRRIDIGVDKENSLQGISLRDFKREVSEDGRKRGLADGDNAAFIRRAGAGGYTNGDYQGAYRDLHDEKRKAGYRQAFAAVSVNPDLALARSLVMCIVPRAQRSSLVSLLICFCFLVWHAFLLWVKKYAGALCRHKKMWHGGKRSRQRVFRMGLMTWREGKHVMHIRISVQTWNRGESKYLIVMTESKKLQDPPTLWQTHGLFLLPPPTLPLCVHLSVPLLFSLPLSQPLSLSFLPLPLSIPLFISLLPFLSLSSSLLSASVPVCVDT